MNKRKKILWVTDDLWQPTGYGSVGRNVLSRLQKLDKYDILSLGLQHTGGVVKVAETMGVKCDVDVHPRYMHPEGYDVLEGYIMKEKPDIVITLRDVGLQAGYIASVNSARSKGWSGKWYGYIPIDTKDCAWKWDQFFSNMDMPIAMSEWGKRMMEEQTKISCFCIPHGVDTKMFRPLKDDELSKEAKSLANSNTFVVGYVGRNQYRKMHNVAIKAFAEFAKDKMDVSFMYHSDIHPYHSADGWDWEYIGRKRGCLNKMIPTIPGMDGGKRFWVDDNKMNEFYNIFDVFLFLTGGEGFGVPIVESQSAGTPIITTAYTTGFELTPDDEFLVPILKDEYGDNIYWEGQNGVDFAIPNWKKAAECLDVVYSEWKKNKKKYDDRCILARDSMVKYDWDLIVKKWEELFDKEPTNRK